MIKFEEGQTYMCTESQSNLWTKRKEYSVIFDDLFDLVIIDDRGIHWRDYEINLLIHKFTLKEKE